MPLQPVPTARLSGARVLYTDLDGTMLGPKGSFLHGPDGVPTHEPAQALVGLLAAGVDVVPVSGRALPGLIRDSRILGGATVIGEMGGLLAYDHGIEIVRNFGSCPEPDRTPREIVDRDGISEALYAAFIGSLEPHLPWSTFSRDVTALMRGRIETALVDAWLEEHGWGWLTLRDNGRLHGAYLGMAAGRARAYHLLPRGVSKGSAVDLDQTRRSIPRDEAVGIGDAAADLELAEHVGTLVIVRDALLDDPYLTDRIAAMDNVFITRRDQNLGWADVANAITNGVA